MKLQFLRDEMLEQMGKHGSSKNILGNQSRRSSTPASPTMDKIYRPIKTFERLMSRNSNNRMGRNMT
jgi:hypothetical protein